MASSKSPLRKMNKLVKKLKLSVQILPLIPFLLCLPSSAQDLSPTIVGEIADGSSAPKSTKKMRTDLKVVRSQEFREDGRKVMMRKVKRPPQSSKSKLTTRRQQTPLSPQDISRMLAEQLPSHNVIVSATVYDRRVTHLQWWSGEQGQNHQLECWSNLDWNYLGGINSFRTGSEEFTFLLLQSNSTFKRSPQLPKEAIVRQPPELLKQLPSLAKSGPLYILTVGDESNTTAIEFMKGIHRLYADQGKALEKAYRKREKANANRRAELARNPPQPEDIEILYWNNTEKD